ncbi:Ctr copper transporter [Mycena pura]|uniref:Copper transport protein n=1 Tax=Mycena pura TaxID=153505 RepID=A0AAD6VPM1_9AGAR|nr:Ctr copper transporter [Mycena pura]
MDSMNMTDPTSTGMPSHDGMGSMMMKTYLHFTPDTVLFASIAPSSAGAIFATCLLFFFISIGDRYLRAVTRGSERRFAQRAKQPSADYHFADAADASSDSRAPLKTPASEAAPFILSNELRRGFFAGLQTTLHYLLMLVVMTFNASYIISVILGVVVGETVFGRLNL